ncbi:MAG: hypothetical protein IKI09_06570, partial [Bacteroidales bacterium]|nr:hypothetical protein [Bacteroidales bacterium]
LAAGTFVAVIIYHFPVRNQRNPEKKPDFDSFWHKLLQSSGSADISANKISGSVDKLMKLICGSADLFIFLQRIIK